MSQDKKKAVVTREGILALLTDAEVARALAR